MLNPTTFLVVLLSTVNLLKEYAATGASTQGGPGLSTTPISSSTSLRRGFNQMSTAVVAVPVVMIVFALSAYAQFQSQQREVRHSG